MNWRLVPDDAELALMYLRAENLLQGLSRAEQSAAAEAGPGLLPTALTGGEALGALRRAGEVLRDALDAFSMPPAEPGHSIRPRLLAEGRERMPLRVVWMSQADIETLASALRVINLALAPVDRRRCTTRSSAGANYKKFGDEPADHAIGRSRGGLTTKTHLVADGKGRALAFILTGGQVADTTMLPATLDEIRVTGASGRPRQRPDRLLADKGYPRRRTGHGCASAESPRRSRNVTTRSPTAASGAHQALQRAPDHLTRPVHIELGGGPRGDRHLMH
jgi:hypothetical protein